MAFSTRRVSPARSRRRQLVVTMYAGFTAFLMGAVVMQAAGLDGRWWIAPAVALLAPAWYAHARLHSFGVNYVDTAHDEAQRLHRRLVFGEAFHELYHAVTIGYVVLVVAIMAAAADEAWWGAARGFAQAFFLSAWYVFSLPSAYVGWMAPDDGVGVAALGTAGTAGSES